MHARVARYRIDPDKCEEAVASFREAGDEIAQLAGFKDGYVLVDRDDGELVSVTLWESAAALETSDAQASSSRRRAIQAVGGEVESVTRYDVAVELGAR
jgi:heme-degrading monooxygenase HmoA